GKVYMATFSNHLVVYGPLSKRGGGYDIGFGSPDGLTFNGSAKVEAGHVRLTDIHPFQTGSIFTTAKVDVRAFMTHFRCKLANAQADGITFTIQGEGPRALGSSGGGLGYGADPIGIPDSPYRITKSVCIKLDLFNNDGSNQLFSRLGIYR